jgi:hypothetical protein
MHGNGFVVSSYCHTGGCVAVAVLPDGAVAVRDNKISDGPILRFSSQEWEQFIAGVKDGEFDFA